ncbi:MAG: GNAT family N-acetyltransferase [Deltaproteobacteria bacterium]|jgi:RimJ/RimL family protein N-acetyltransferase|nr:GNAT family N-acetyltransferase [Deltaproteobacteria bacterium]
MKNTELPCIARLRNGKSATLALAEASDGALLLEFYRSMSEEDRLVLKDDVTTAEWLDRFLAALHRGEALSVVGKLDGEIRGEATLYRTLHGWARHVGEIRLNVDRSARGQGLGLELARHIVKLAIDRGIDKLVAHMVDSQIAAKRTFEKLGFHKEAELPGHVKDILGKKYDLLVYANDVSYIWSAMESMLGDFRPDRATR